MLYTSWLVASLPTTLLLHVHAYCIFRVRLLAEILKILISRKYPDLGKHLVSTHYTYRQTVNPEMGIAYC